jgi:capsular polysaccharide biosynthesis protein
VLSATAMMVALAAAPVMAQQQRQEGLVNLAVGDVTVQVPVAIAANVCDVAVNVVAQNTEPGETTTCEALAEAAAESPGNGSPNQRQEGLVNLAIGDVTVQVPVAVAANVCDVAVNVVATNTEPGGTTTCEALADAAAQN